MEVFRIGTKRRLFPFLHYVLNRLFMYKPCFGTELYFFKPKKGRAQFVAGVKIKGLFGARTVLLMPSQLKDLAAVYNRRMELVINASKAYALERAEEFENKAGTK